MDKIIGYVRVSTLTQVKVGHSLDFQKEAIKKYCKNNDLILEKTYIERGLSAKKDRPEYDKMMKYIVNNADIKGIIVNDLTRFGRTTSELLTQIEYLKNMDKKFISVKEKIDISTKTGRLILGVLALIADFEHDTILERLQEGRAWLD